MMDLARKIWKKVEFYRPDMFKTRATMAQFFVNKEELRSSYGICDFLGYMLGDYTGGVIYDFEIRDVHGNVCQRHTQVLQRCETYEFIPDYANLPELGSCYVSMRLNQKLGFKLWNYRRLYPHFYVRYAGTAGIGLVHNQTTLVRKPATNLEWFSSCSFYDCDEVELLILNPSKKKLAGKMLLMNDSLDLISELSYDIEARGVSSIKFKTNSAVSKGYRIGMIGMGAANAKPHAIVRKANHAYFTHT